MNKLTNLIIVLFVFMLTLTFLSATKALSQVYPEGMISYWKFEEGTGTTAYDTLGNNNGTINGATWVTGKVGGALSFDGNDYIDIGFISSSAHVTLEAWIKLPNNFTSPDSPIIAKEFGTGYYTSSYNLALEPNKQPRFLINVDGYYWDFLRSPDLINEDTWYHIVGTYDGSEMKIYVDGVLKGTFSVVGSVNEGNANVFIGYNGGIRYHIGLIDEVAIYNRALSPEEIEQHYQNGLNGLGYEIITGEAECDGEQVTIVGTEDHDIIYGTDGPDVIHGLGGNDVIFGLDGDDRICGGDGDDIISGGGGSDRLFGNSGNDVIRGNGGGDKLFGGNGYDTLAGGRGNDKLKGGAGNDTLKGGTGDDELIGGANLDVCDGSEPGDIVDVSCEEIGN